MTGIQKINQNSPNYPPLLKEITDPPKQLFYKGNIDLLKNPLTVAVVGTRKATAYGFSATDKLVSQISKHGIIVVSGLARGIDAAAHKACLKSNGKTIAVLGGGIDKKTIYPPEHKNLIEKILEKEGLVISEYEPGTPPLKHHFIARNRIIAGISKTVMVVEAPEKSGALITADLAVDYNREVLAVPGSITSPNSKGTNKLISQGAKVVLSAQDVLEIFEMLPLKDKGEKLKPRLPQDQEKIIQILTENGSLSLTEIVEISGLDVPTLTKNLTSLELNDKIISSVDGKYAVK